MTRNAFYTKWLEMFASSVRDRDIKQYVQSKGNYLWHVFAWELLSEHSYLVGDDAKKAYDEADKRGARYIEWFEDDHTNDVTWELTNAIALDAFTEIYVVGKDFEWTYIKIHESMCGPYFMKR